MGGFRKLDEELLHSGYVIDLYRDRFEAPDGSVIERDVVRHPGAVAVVPLLDDGNVVLVRQFRAPLGREMLEIPAGKLDVEGESLEVAAGRELTEEVGLVAGSMEMLVRFHNSVGFCDEESHVFLATELTETEMDRQGVEETHMTEVRLPLSESPAAIASGEITDAKTVLGLMAALQHQGGTIPHTPGPS
ncbi:MAG: NUDIX domain-containing protein [Microthrixaceae bacterium]